MATTEVLTERYAAQSAGDRTVDRYRPLSLGSETGNQGAVALQCLGANTRLSCRGYEWERWTMDQDAWTPITEEEMRDLFEEQLAACTPDRREIFERYRVPLYRAPLVRYGNKELVFIVAVKDGEALYYEDVEDGFNRSPMSESGEILQHWCNQDDLQDALYSWMPGVTPSGRFGPATPLE